MSKIKFPDDAGPLHTTDPRVEDVVRVLKEKPDQSIAKLAKLLGLSRWRLSHIASEVLGMDLRAWKKNFQLEKASRLLMETNLPVKEIRWLCGIVDGPNFSHAFRERFGVSPKEFRQGKRERRAIAATQTNK